MQGSFLSILKVVLLVIMKKDIICICEQIFAAISKCLVRFLLSYDMYIDDAMHGAPRIAI
jgi:hypothetical protein